MMALKPFRLEGVIQSFYFTDTAERGGMASINLKQPYKDYTAISYNKNTDCIPVGILLHDVVDIDYTKYPITNDMQKIQGGKVDVLSRGIITTNQIIGNPTHNTPGLFYPYGQIFAWCWNKRIPGKMSEYIVGVFMSEKDQDGFAKFKVDIYEKTY
jgi:hypothetical protein